MSKFIQNSTSFSESASLFLTLLLRIFIAYVEAIVKLIVPSKNKDIRGQNALITGSGHGLGRELALKLAQSGTNLVLVDINETNNERVKQEILKRDNSLKILNYSIDIGDETKVAQLAAKVRAELGDIDILINNAGIVQCQPFLKLSPAFIERTFQVNSMAHFWTLRHFLPSMIKNKRGHIVAISSIGGLIGSKYMIDYCASKFANVGMMDSLDKELHENGANPNIHLTTVCPASMSTGMFQTFTSRFSWLLPVLDAREVADHIVDAILTNRSFIAVPPITLYLHRISIAIPVKVSDLIQEYLAYGVEPNRRNE